MLDAYCKPGVFQVLGGSRQINTLIKVCCRVRQCRGPPSERKRRINESWKVRGCCRRFSKGREHFWDTEGAGGTVTRLRSHHPSPRSQKATPTEPRILQHRLRTPYALASSPVQYQHHGPPTSKDQVWLTRDCDALGCVSTSSAMVLPSPTQQCHLDAVPEWD